MKKELLAAFLLITGCAIGQELPVTPTIVPPAPEATSVFKFSEVPVSLYTGVPEITIPIYEIVTKSLSIPINLSYHARGIRVEEVAPRIGVGWSLNYGGMISRQVRGKPDDFAPNAYLEGDFYETFFSNLSTRVTVFNDYVNGDADLEPDQFFFNAIGSSGKFVFDQYTKQPVVQDFDNIKITSLFQSGFHNIIGWIVTDKGGNKFYYGTVSGVSGIIGDKASSDDFSYSMQNGMEQLVTGDVPMYTTWHLLKIETPYKETINFIYQAETPVYYRRSYDIKSGSSDVKCYFSKVSSTQYQIKEIQFNNGKVVFTRSAQLRQDLNNGHTLEKVEVFNQSNELIKGYHFQYHYVTSPDNANQLSYLKNIDPKSSKRLFLSSIQQVGVGSDILPPYQFEYNAIPLPNRFSNSQDSWGYYNGKNNGPFLTFFDYGSYTVNREVDTVKSAAGILQKVIYPTGGEVSFFYEHNIAVPPIFMDELIYDDPNPSAPLETISDGFFKSPLYYNGNYYSKTVTIGAGLVGDVQSEVSFTQSQGCSTTSNLPDCNFRVELQGASGSYPLFMGVHTHNFSPGTYTLKVIPQNNDDPNDFQNSFIVSLQWQEPAEPSEPTDPIMYGGGKRIKRIEYRDGGNLLKFKEYSYLDPQGKTSGKIFGLPNFYYVQRTVGGMPVVDKYGSRPGSPLASLQGNSVGYSHVTEYYGGADANQGKTEYTFTVYEDAGDYYKFPYHLPTDNEWLRGKPISTKIFEYNGSYTLKKSIQNTYRYADIGAIPSVYLGSFQYPDPVYLNTRSRFSRPLIIFIEDPDDPLNSGADDYKFYHLSGGTADLASTVETMYENGQEIQTVINYDYNLSNHYQPVVRELINSKGETVISKTYFPNDVTSVNSLGEALTSLEKKAIDSLKANQQHRMTEPVQVETTVKNAGGTVLSKSIRRTNYKLWQGNIVLPEYVQTAKDSRPLQDRIQYYDYNASGGPQEVSQKGGPLTSYLWNYQGEYPVAEAKNASQSDIAYTSFEADGKGNWSYSGAVSTSASYALTGKKYYAISGNMSKSGLSSTRKYLLSYWQKGGTVSVSGGTVGAAVSGRSYNGWTYIERIVGGATTVSLSGSGYIDQVRLHPVAAAMTTYTYDPLVGMTSQTDASGNILYYEYDNFQRLRAIRDQNGKLIEDYDYHYRNQ